MTQSLRKFPNETPFCQKRKSLWTPPQSLFTMRNLVLLALVFSAVGLLSSCGSKYGEPSNSLHGRMLCAANVSYDISPTGAFAREAPMYGGAGFQEEVKIYQGGTENIHAALLARTQDGIVVAFRGTLGPQEVSSASLRDWLNNLMGAAPVEVPAIEGKVQEGFWTALQVLWEPLLRDLKAMKKSDEKIYVTGHSKGGAIATLFAARLLEEEKLEVKEVVTFGAPKVFNEAAAKAYESRIRQFSYECNTDLVPFVAPAKSFITLCGHIPVFGDLFQKAEDWDYESFGEIRLIGFDGKIGDGDFWGSLKRGGEFVSFLTKGSEGLEKIVSAHASGCGGTYFRALCPDLDCPGK